MARNADRLAGLAALAGAAYLYNKDKDKGPKGKEDTGPGYQSTETREAPRRQITDYMATAPQDPREAGSESSSASSDIFAMKPRAPAPAAVENNAPTTPMASAADRTDQLAGLSRAVKREDATKKAAQGEFSNVTRKYKYTDGTPAVEVQKKYDTLNKESGANKSSAQKTDALAVASRAARAADAKRRAARQSSYKSGGMVSKVSSASKRADGIASKGKTRGKIC
jgi:hypothetical protein